MGSRGLNSLSDNVRTALVDAASASAAAGTGTGTGMGTGNGR